MAADWLNYHHLLYFWTMAKEGSVTAACRKLHVAQPTVSTQLRQLEQRVGEKLYERSGRGIALTEVGQVVFRYADEIFSIGEELVDTLQRRSVGRSRKLHVGVPDVLPKLIAYRLLAPVLSMDQGIRLVCREEPLEQLLAKLTLHELDVVLSDSPASGLARIRAFNHELGACGVGLFATAALCERYGKGLPESLGDAPMMLPGAGTQMRRNVERWLMHHKLRPNVLAEIDDTALMKVFAEAGMAIVPAPLAIRGEIERQFGLRLLIECAGIHERYYAISVERRLRNPAVAALCDLAREGLFPRSAGDGEVVTDGEANPIESPIDDSSLRG